MSGPEGRRAVPEAAGPVALALRLAASARVADAAPPYGFDVYEDRARTRRVRRRARRRATALVATGLVLAAALAPWLAWRGAEGPRAAAAAAPAAAPAGPVDESWLALLPPEPAVISVETRMAVVALEDRIAWIDDSLSTSATRGDVLARIHQLETERARLVDSLVRVRYAEQLAAASR